MEAATGGAADAAAGVMLLPWAPGALAAAAERCQGPAVPGALGRTLNLTRSRGTFPRAAPLALGTLTFCRGGCTETARGGAGLSSMRALHGERGGC